MDFINQTELDKIPDRASTIEAFFSYTQRELKRETNELIAAENLNAEPARRYIDMSIKREYASDSGTELNDLLPKMSPLNPQYLDKKQKIFEKLSAFVEKFKGIGSGLLKALRPQSRTIQNF